MDSAWQPSCRANDSEGQSVITVFAANPRMRGCKSSTGSLGPLLMMQGPFCSQQHQPFDTATTACHMEISGFANEGLTANHFCTGLILLTTSKQTQEKQQLSLSQNRTLKFLNSKTILSNHAC